MRLPGWQAALQAVMQSAHGKRFRWGRHDCCQFIARASLAVTGVDRRAIFERYTTRAGAEEILELTGGMEGLLTLAFGEPVHPSRAMQGDCVLAEIGNGLQPALCMGLNAYAPGRRNLVYVPTLSAIKAWNL